MRQQKLSGLCILNQNCPIWTKNEIDIKFSVFEFSVRSMAGWGRLLLYIKQNKTKLNYKTSILQNRKNEVSVESKRILTNHQSLKALLSA